MGKPRPSAKPRTMRQMTRAVRLWARKGVTNVAMLHNKTLQIRTFLAPSLLAQKLPTNEFITCERNRKSMSYLKFD